MVDLPELLKPASYLEVKQKYRTLFFEKLEATKAAKRKVEEAGSPKAFDKALARLDTSLLRYAHTHHLLFDDPKLLHILNSTSFQGQCGDPFQEQDATNGIQDLTSKVMSYAWFYASEREPVSVDFTKNGRVREISIDSRLAEDYPPVQFALLQAANTYARNSNQCFKISTQEGPLVRLSIKALSYPIQRIEFGEDYRKTGIISISETGLAGLLEQEVEFVFNQVVSAFVYTELIHAGLKREALKKHLNT